MASSAVKRARPSVPYSSRPAIGFRIPRLRFEVKLVWLLSLLTVPALLLCGATLFLWHPSIVVDVSISLVLILLLAFTAAAVFHHIVRPLQTLSNVVAALRENEYSFRARDVGEGDALGDLAAQINELSGALRTRRHRESETFALLERVVETMDLPVFAFDSSAHLQLTNPAASKMLQMPAESLLHKSAESLGLAEILQCAENSIVALNLHGREGRWIVRRSSFYQNGIPHTLLLLSDVSSMLREQERQAWQRLIRVLAHEVNNSLTPIKSIAGSLRMQTQKFQTSEWTGSGSGSSAREQAKMSFNPVDMGHGLAIIEERAESLNRFLQTYSQLAKLPPPVRSIFSIRPILQRVCHLETRLHVALDMTGDLEIYADAAQLEQALINLVRNGADAAMQTVDRSASVQVSCKVMQDFLQIVVEDNGVGLANPANLFIPFYTTKPGGTGIGLILVLQIVEAHGGKLTLVNRSGMQGCRAEIRLPLFDAGARPS